MGDQTVSSGQAGNSNSLLSEIQAGYILQFGAMKQSLLNRKRYVAQEVWTYNIDLQKLYAFVLNTSPDNLLYLIAGDENGQEYLTISSQVSQEMLEEFSGIKNFVDWLKTESTQPLRLYGKPGGRHKNWLATSYVRVMHNVTGYVYPADYRGRLLSGDAASGKEFQYFLLVSQDQRHALDCELYPDGRLRVFATLYRPASDIRQIIPAPALENIRRTEPRRFPGIPDDSAHANGSTNGSARPAAVRPLAAPAVSGSFRAALGNAVSQQTDSLQTEKRTDAAAETAKPEAPKEAASGEATAATISAANDHSQDEPREKLADSASSPALEAKTAQATIEAAQEPEPDSETINLATVDKVTQTAVSSPAKVAEKSPRDSVEMGEKPVEARTSAAQKGSNTSAPSEHSEAAKTDSLATESASEHDPVEAPSSATAGNPMELDFELKLAATLIEEASRNHLTLEKVIRKVLGLELSVSEHVHFRLQLSDEDYAQLAKRYTIPATETGKIREEITRELVNFAGNGHPKKQAPVIRDKKIHPKHGHHGHKH